MVQKIITTLITLLMLTSCHKAEDQYPSIHKDILVENWEYPPKLEAVQIESGGKLLNGILFQTADEGLHPTILLLHGFPGYENNFDLAHILMRSGWNVLIIHYRGAWGSPGTFTFSNAVEDAFSALEFLRDPGNSRKYQINRTGIIPIGHSMGGFIALYLASKDNSLAAAASIAGFNFGAHAKLVRDDEKAREETISNFEGALTPLNSPGAEVLVEEYLQKGEEWSLEALISPIKNRSLLLLVGNRDEVAPPSLHHTLLVEKMEERDGIILQSEILETDHGFTNRRVELAKILIKWLQKHDQI